MSAPASSSAPAPLTEQLSATIPRLNSEGANWAVFSMRFREAMQTTHRWGYFDGSKAHPAPKDKANPSETETEAMERWDYEDQVARYFLSQRLPDETAMEVSTYQTAKERWDAVMQEYTAKSAYAKNDLEQAFLEMRCPKGGDVCAFLTSLRTRRNELMAAGVTISDRDFERTVL
jgi:hypothetical protein